MTACGICAERIAISEKILSGAGAGLLAVLPLQGFAPMSAMWIATTFGTASTGTAISALSGAAATKAALAWLGGGALSSGGGGMAAGSAFLAMAGPIGWGIGGATLLTSIVLFATKKTRLKLEKNKRNEGSYQKYRKGKEHNSKSCSAFPKKHKSFITN